MAKDKHSGKDLQKNERDKKKKLDRLKVKDKNK